MKFLTAIKSVLVLLAVVLLNSLTFVGHSAAMSTMSHEMTGMNHQSSSDAASCASLCRTAVLSNESTNPKQLEDDDDEDNTAVHLPQQGQTWELSSSLVRQRLYASEVKPPPKVPFYILFQVFRT